MSPRVPFHHKPTFLQFTKDRQQTSISTTVFEDKINREDVLRYRALEPISYRLVSCYYTIPIRLTESSGLS
jgi:hypothetical protein